MASPFLPAPIGEIAPEAPVSSLLTTARVLQDADGPIPFERWRSGVQWLPNAGAKVAGWSDCEDPDRPDEKCDPNYQTVEDIRPWTIYVPDGCLNLPSGDIDYNGRVSRIIDAYCAAAVARELATGEHGSGTNPSLESVATDLTTGAVTVQEAISLLLQARENVGAYGMNTVHVPSWLIPGGDNSYLFSNVGTIVGLGNVRLSPGPGYPGRDTTGVPPLTGEGYIYMTGPVEYALGPVQLPMTKENQRVRTNQSQWIAERPAIVRFDTSDVFCINARIGA